MLTVKENQKTLFYDIQSLCSDEFTDEITTVDKGHGRLEERRLQVTTVLNDYVNFPHVKQVARITRSVTKLKTNESHSETVYCITSLPTEEANPSRLLMLNRNHWSIENKSHWVRDVTFDEDRSQIRKGNGPRVMASLRNFAISLLRLLGVKNIKRECRKLSMKSHLILNMLGI